MYNGFLTKITAAQNEAAFSYHSVRRLYFLAVVFTATVLFVSLSFYSLSLSKLVAMVKLLLEYVKQ